MENKKKVFPISSPYLGEKATFSENELDIKFLSNANFDVIENFNNEKIAILLSKNYIVARCVGNSEYGARALGNRSILANPKDINNVKKIHIDNVKYSNIIMVNYNIKI